MLQRSRDLNFSDFSVLGRLSIPGTVAPFRLNHRSTPGLFVLLGKRIVNVSLNK